jgi:hypothetical protein
MKLYTEEQLTRYILNEGIIELSDLANNLIPHIELPSDEEINKEIEWLDNPLDRLNFKSGIKWMRDKIRIQGR